MTKDKNKKLTLETPIEVTLEDGKLSSNYDEKIAEAAKKLREAEIEWPESREDLVQAAIAWDEGEGTDEDDGPARVEASQWGVGLRIGEACYNLGPDKDVCSQAERIAAAINTLVRKEKDKSWSFGVDAGARVQKEVFKIKPPPPEFDITKDDGPVRVEASEIILYSFRSTDLSDEAVQTHAAAINAAIEAAWKRGFDTCYKHKTDVVKERRKAFDECIQILQESRLKAAMRNHLILEFIEKRDEEQGDG